MHAGRHLRAIAAAIALLVAACGGGGDDDEAATTGDTQPTTETTAAAPGEGGDTQVDGATGAGGGPATTKPGAAAGQPGSGGAGSSGSGGGSGGGTPTTAASNAGSGATTSKAAKAGRYTFNRTGKRTIPGVGEQSLNGAGTLTVDPPSGSDQHTLLHYNPYDSTEQTVRYRDDGIDLLMLKLETQAGTFEFRPSPPVLFAPDPLKVGATWAWRMTSTDGRLTLDSSFKVVRAETQPVGGEAVATSVVEATINLSGVLSGTIRQTLWASERYRLIVRIDEVSDLTGGVHSESSSVMASTTPA